MGIFSLDASFSWIDFLWHAFSLTLLALTVTFLSSLHGHEHRVPDFNQTLYEFVLVSHWILVAMTAVAILMPFLGWVVERTMRNKQTAPKRRKRAPGLAKGKKIARYRFVTRTNGDHIV